MADKQLAIALVGTDEASGVVGQSARKMAADLEALQKRTFDVGHDARARELRELSNHYDTLAAQYKAQHQRLAKYAADLEKQIGPGGLRILSPEWDAKFKELKQVRALMARNEDVQAGAAKAKKAEQDELSKQYEGAAAEKRAADLAAIERRIFDSSHSARDRELRDVREHADRLRAQYQSEPRCMRRSPRPKPRRSRKSTSATSSRRKRGSESCSRRAAC
jgi:methylaspartate ammonia-lyase